MRRRKHSNFSTGQLITLKRPYANIFIIFYIVISFPERRIMGQSDQLCTKTGVTGNITNLKCSKKNEMQQNLMMEHDEIEGKLQ